MTFSATSTIFYGEARRRSLETGHPEFSNTTFADWGDKDVTVNGRRVRLRMFQVGRRRATTVQDLDEFLNAITQPLSVATMDAGNAETTTNASALGS